MVVLLIYEWDTLVGLVSQTTRSPERFVIQFVYLLGMIEGFEEGRELEAAGRAETVLA